MIMEKKRLFLVCLGGPFIRGLPFMIYSACTNISAPTNIITVVKRAFTVLDSR